MNKADRIFKHNLELILFDGCVDEDPRPRYKSDGEPAHSIYITQVFEKYHLFADEFPITSLRPIPWKNAVKEGQWIYQDQTADLKVLKEKYDIHWWDLWGLEDGTIGQRYGATVSLYDMVNRLIKSIKEDPFGRRHIMNLWQEEDLKKFAKLPPCAYETLWSVRKMYSIPLGKDVYYLDCTLVQRSSDYLVAGHVNMIQYVALQMMIAHELGMVAGSFARLTQNLHVYDRHLEQLREILVRAEKFEEHQELHPSYPKLVLHAEGKGFYDITVDDFELVNYNPMKPQMQFDLGV